MAAGLSLSEIVARLGGTLIDDNGVKISQAASLTAAGPRHISFLAQNKFRAQLAATRAGAVILAADAKNATTLPRIVAGNPYAYFARVSQMLNPQPQPAPGIHPSAVVDADADIAASACIGAFTCIGKNVKVGARTVIGENCLIGDETVIVDDCTIHPGVVMYPRCQIGARTIVHSGTVIGADGFGMAEEEGQWVKVPQLGRVIIGADVEIGANTTIDRGTSGDTVIEDGVKMDNQIQIGHNVRVGAHTAIAGCAGIAGSARIGRHCKIGGRASILGHIAIADNVTVTACAFISKSIEAPGVYGGSYPFSEQSEWRRNAVHLRNLDALAKKIRELEAQVAALRKNK
ncbi:MAG: UDP-3-O-(3-hydroxymyristoyl)glucosamine N-acyltransferase [Burkholderiales bacterium]